jgi:phenylpropionate dioxygenase-like ring-hydroxylating dioxygenase large terminal subunit
MNAHTVTHARRKNFPAALCDNGAVNPRTRRSNQPDLRRVACNPNYWYPLTAARRLKRNTTLAVSFAGDPIVLVRTESSKVFALEDRCAHRQFPLSKGIVCGEQIQCGYHAWRYDASGAIASIPYLLEGGAPPGHARAYPCREAYGLIFVFPGDPALADRTPFPHLPFHTEAYKPMLFERQVGCHYTFMHENLMDMNHQVLHQRLLGSVKPQLLSHTSGEGWVEAQYHFRDMGGKRHRGVRWVGIGSDDDEKSYDVMTIRTDYPYQTLKISGSSPNSVPSLSLWAAYVPVDRQDRVSRSFGILLIRKPRLAFVLTLIWPVLRHFAASVFAEDRMAVEAEQRAYETQGGDWNQEIFPVIMDLRDLLLKQGISPAGAGT